MTTYDAIPSLDRRGTRFLVTDTFGHDLVKARLPLHPGGSTALSTPLECPAPYAGATLYVAPSVATDVERIERRYRQRNNNGR
jgi:hypothetical protein